MKQILFNQDDEPLLQDDELLCIDCLNGTMIEEKGNPGTYFCSSCTISTEDINNYSLVVRKLPEPVVKYYNESRRD